MLQCLCPALHSLLTDGLKPHQSDLISGRRPNSAWGLVQASTKPGSMSGIIGKLIFLVLDIKNQAVFVLYFIVDNNKPCIVSVNYFQSVNTC